MEFDFLGATLVNLSINIVYTLIALFVGMKALLIIDDKLLKSIDIQEEMKKGNIAVSIFASTILIFVALIVTFGFKGWYFLRSLQTSHIFAYFYYIY